MVHVGSSFMLHLEECCGVLGYNSVSSMLVPILIAFIKIVRTISWEYSIFVVDQLKIQECIHTIIHIACMCIVEDREMILTIIPRPAVFFTRMPSQMQKGQNCGCGSGGAKTKKLRQEWME